MKKSMPEHNIHIPSAKVKQIYLMHYIGFELKTFYETPCNKGLMCTVKELTKKFKFPHSVNKIAIVKHSLHLFQLVKLLVSKV